MKMSDIMFTIHQSYKSVKGTKPSDLVGGLSIKVQKDMRETASKYV